MADTKRRFYTSDFNKLAFFTAVLAMATGEEMDSDIVDKLAKGAEYEIEGIKNRPSKAGTGEKKDVLQCDLAKKIRADILPLLTTSPQTSTELIDQCTAAGKVAPSGKAYTSAWVGRILNNEPNVTKVQKVVQTIKPDGLKEEKAKPAYIKG